MTAKEETAERLHLRRKLLFTKANPLFLPLEEKLSSSSRIAVALWAFEICGKIKDELASKDKEQAEEAIEICREWMKGKVKMNKARYAILALHHSAGEKDPVTQAKMRAIAQGLSCVHTPGHAMGIPIYYFTALVREYGIDDGFEKCMKTVREYEEILEKYCKTNSGSNARYAGFLYTEKNYK